MNSTLIVISSIILGLIMIFRESGNPFARRRKSRPENNKGSTLLAHEQATQPTEGEWEWIRSFDRYRTRVDRLLKRGKKEHVELFYLMWAAQGVVKAKESDFQQFKSSVFWTKYKGFLNKSLEILRYSDQHISMEERENIMKKYGKHPRVDTDAWTFTPSESASDS